MDGAPHVVAIDDDPGLRGLYRDFLEGEGYRVTALPVSPDGPASLAALAPDALLLDLRLAGGGDGAATLAALRADPSTAAVPVVVVTGDVRAADALRPVLGALGAALLLKPFDLDDLLAAVAGALARRA